MKYTINQYPKNKDISNKLLSVDQKKIRAKQKKYNYGDSIRCRSCQKDQPINEYYIKDKCTGRRSTKCRDCQMKHSGVTEIGKQRFSDKLGEKGFRRCSVCKTIKPLTEYSKQKGKYLGRASNCKECNKKAVKSLQISGRKDITDWYVRKYGKQKGISEFDKDTMLKLRNEIIESRKPKYFIDDLEFVTLRDFARYIKSKYDIGIRATEKRISQGKTENQCKLSESEMRSESNTKAKIKVIDCVTKEEFIFKNTRDPELLKMFCGSTVNIALKTNKIVGGKRSKYKNPCRIVRIKN